MKNLFIDLETSSSVDLPKAGVYKYCESPDFRILLFACSADGEPVEVYDLAHGDALPTEILSALTDRAVIKWAYNSAFERVCLSKFLGYPVGSYIPPEQFRCAMTWGGYLGLPMSLEKISEVMHLKQGKLDTGRSLIRKFCKPGVKLPMRDDPYWVMFCEYCKRDVEAEMEICEKLAPWPVPEFVWQEFFDSERINDRGVAIDRRLVRNAIRFNEEAAQGLREELEKLTGLDNPNSVQQLKTWLREQGVEADSLDKEAIEKLIGTVPDVVDEVLKLRLLLSKSSVKKFQKMELSVNSDGKVRGMFRFYGANRTGRFASRIIQLQNLPKNHMDDLGEAREMVKAGDLKAFQQKYPDVLDVLSQLVRTAFVPSLRGEYVPNARKETQKHAPAAPSELSLPPDPCILSPKFLVADESSIEARVIAWFAGEKWRIKAFADGKDIYCESASQMFHVPVEKNGVNGHLRPKGKVAELALGYQGGVGALKKMGALDMGLSEAELQPIVDAWRSANPRIVKFWYDVGDAALAAVKLHCTAECHGLKFIWQKGFLFIELLSGRRLAYYDARIGENQYGECITYYGIGATKKWEKLETSPGRLVENIVQATARDVLCYALGNLDDRPVVMHVHDEIICEADGSLSLEELRAVMGRTPPWAPGLLLKAEGDEMTYYRKA